MAATRRLSDASWRSAVTAAYRLEANSIFAGCLHSVRQQFCLSSPAGFRHCYCSLADSGCGDGGKCCRSGSHLSRVVSCWPEVSSASRDGRLVGVRLSGNAGVCSDNVNNGSRRPGIVFQTRGLAAKAKKAKTKVELSESTEDIAAAAKGNAVKMMETALDVLSREHSKFRTGRASAGMLDHITVDAHGVRTPLNHIAAVTVSGLQTLNVLPYDASMVKEVEKAILNSPMGLNPQVDGATMTVPLPSLSSILIFVHLLWGHDQLKLILPIMQPLKDIPPLVRLVPTLCGASDMLVIGGWRMIRLAYFALCCLARLTKEHCETMCKLVSKAGESAKLTVRRARKEALDTVKSCGDLSKDEVKRFEKEVEELTKKYAKSIDDTCKTKEKEIMA